MKHEWRGRGMRIVYRWESQKERYLWEDQDVDDWTILKWLIGRYDGRYGLH
jgi:hypothetical protein